MPFSVLRSLVIVLVVLCASLAAQENEKKPAARPAYDPLRLPAKVDLKTHDLVVKDERRKREIPIRIYLDAARPGPAPVVLFSHGLGGSREGSSFLGRHWASRGYVCVFLQHPGSDESVWKNVPVLRRREVLSRAASFENSRLRNEDVPAVLDQLERWNAEKDHLLKGRLDIEHVGMSGHSFGAVTTQAVSGQSFGLMRRRASYEEKRIDAAIAFSPSSPKAMTAKAAFGGVKIPWLLMTGTEDVSIIGDTDVASRLAVFPALQKGGKYELVLEGAQHHAFTDGGERGLAPRNPAHHPAILAISTAFWDAWLRGDEEARKWLDGKGPRSVLAEKDRWQTKLD
ncbi:MAG: dienelactone hydrolase [Planctomycetota bacterium]